MKQIEIGPISYRHQISHQGCMSTNHNLNVDMIPLLAESFFQMSETQFLIVINCGNVFKSFFVLYLNELRFVLTISSITMTVDGLNGAIAIFLLKIGALDLVTFGTDFKNTLPIDVGILLIF